MPPAALCESAHIFHWEPGCKLLFAAAGSTLLAGEKKLLDWIGSLVMVVQEMRKKDIGRKSNFLGGNLCPFVYHISTFGFCRHNHHHNLNPSTTASSPAGCLDRFRHISTVTYSSVDSVATHIGYIRGAWLYPPGSTGIGFSCLKGT